MLFHKMRYFAQRDGVLVALWLAFSLASLVSAALAAAPNVLCLGR